MKAVNWLALSLLAILSWGLSGVALKLAADRIAPLPNQVLSAIGMVLVALFASPGWWRDRTKTVGLLFGFSSGLFGALGNLGVLAALTEHGSEAAIIFPLTALYPGVTVLVATLLMRESIRSLQVLGVVIAIGAVVLLGLESKVSFLEVLGTALQISRWFIYALTAMVLFGFAAVLQKLATNHISGEAAFATFASAFIPVSAFICFTQAWPAGLETPPVVYGIVGGSLNGIGVLATLAAYRAGGKAAIVTPLAALYPIVTILIAITFLGEQLTGLQWLGVFLAVVAGVCLARE